MFRRTPRLARPSIPTGHGRTGMQLAALLLAAVTAAGGAAAAGLADARTDSVRIALVPGALEYDAGDTVTVELVVPQAGLPFNAYDAYVGYDRQALTFLQRDNVADQEGPLMREACYQTFHVFDIAPDSSYVEIHHVLLCNDIVLTGPGVLYRLQFLCNDVDADTPLRFLLESPTQTRFYNAGLLVEPLAVTDVEIRIGAGSVTSTLPSTPGLQLRIAPNPFNPRTTLDFALPNASWTALDIHDLAGRHVRTLVHGDLPAGRHAITWDGRDDRGGAVAAGIYLARLRTAAGHFASRRLTLVR